MVRARQERPGRTRDRLHVAREAGLGRVDHEWSSQRSIGLVEEALRTSEVARTLFEGVEVPFGSLNREEVPSVHVQRHRELLS